MRWLIFCALCVRAVCGCVVEAQDGGITGEVRDEDKRTIEGAVVRLDDSHDSTRASQTGAFSISHVRPGAHVLRITSVATSPFELKDVHVDSARTTALGVIVVQSLLAREIFLGCRDQPLGDASTTKCFLGRPIAAPVGIPRGAGIVRDSTTWRLLWDRTIGKDSSEGRVYLAEHIDWRQNMVVLVSMGDDMIDPGGGSPTKINRVIEGPDSVRVVLGPDSLRRRKPTGGASEAVMRRPNAALVPYSAARTVFQYPAPVAKKIEVVDWAAIARAQK
jgi:hypothetical protein